MANMNGKDCGSSHNPDTVICGNLKVIKTDKKNTNSSYKSGKTRQESMERARAYKICCLEKAEESLDVYLDIMTCISIGNFKKTEIIQSSVDEYIKKDDAIEKLIKESSALLNGMRVKLEEANNAACAMSNCIKNKILPKSGDVNTKPKLVEIEEALKEITDKTKKLDEKGQNAFESVVTIAGIQTFTNTESLKGFAKLLMEAMKKFKDCVNTNIESTDDDVTSIREQLNTTVEELAQVICDKKGFLTHEEGLEAVIKFVCEGECDDNCLDLCKEIKDYCNPDKEEKTSRRRRRKKQSADQN
ncbi:hypothetical protein OOZ15_10225 [Galbibacter sp. EGI 63066]|uniref:hypothetical protein n=1 Tax=Galbibacter sp. EGI 63066 TaxID=2993559 RepID=UPI002249906F|nr:hypothetical protein [Galbibacter sp. EGI 63066]MCX2680316.1 hypothetical protein [Galbibacter sp. EGI 63066]